MDEEPLPLDAMEVVATELVEGSYASEETLHSSVAFLRNTLAAAGVSQDLDLLSREPRDVVNACNTVYGLLLQHQRDAKFKEQLKTEVHRARVELTAADRERVRLEARLRAKERELGALTNKSKASDEARREETRAARREAEEAARRLAGAERRCVQLAHEAKRKEKEYERLQEKLSHYLADKKRHERAALDMAGKLAAGGAAGGAAPRGARSDEGLKAVVASYEARVADAERDARGLRAALSSLQGEYKMMANAQALASARGTPCAGGVSLPGYEEVAAALPTGSEEELRQELATRAKLLARRLDSLPALPAPAGAGVAAAACEPSGDGRRAVDMRALRDAARQQQALLSAAGDALRALGQTREAQHQADQRRLAQHYQGQLAAAEAEIERAREAQAEVDEGALRELRSEVDELRAAADRRAAEAEAVALARLRAEADTAALRQQADRFVEERGTLQRDNAELAQQAAASAAAAAAAAAEAAQEREALQARVAAASENQARFEAMQRNYQSLMSKYAPGVGAGLFLERAVARKAAEQASAEAATSGGGEQTAISAHFPVAVA